MKYLFPLSPYNQQRQWQKPVWVYPVHLAMYATYLRNKGNYVNWGLLSDDFDRLTIDNGNMKIIENDSQIDIPFLDLPAPDRVFTDAKNSRWQSYGNYKYHHATHMMSALGCLHGKCSFCFEKGKPYQVRPPEVVADEVMRCYEQGFKEIFDDSATLPDNDWMSEFVDEVFCDIKLGCNLRIDCDNDFDLMRFSGYRMVLFGVESANQHTLDKINKGINSKDIEVTLRRASRAGLEPHITVMFGYPWETHSDAMNTVRMAHELLLKGYAKSVQASIFCPPRAIPDANNPNHQYIKLVYDIYKNPKYWIRKIQDIRNFGDVAYLLKRLNLIREAK